MNNNLNNKQKMFCHEYVVDFNASKAAVRAGYTPSYGAVLLSKSDVAEYLTEIIQEKKNSIAINEDMIIRELSSIAFSRFSDFVKIEYDSGESTPQLRIISTGELNQEQLAAVDEIKQTSQGIAIKLHDKAKALELLGKHIGMFAGRPQLDDVTLDIIIDYGAPSDKKGDE